MSIKYRLREFKKSMAHNMQESKFMLTRIKKSPLSIAGILIVLFFVAVALLAPVLAPPPPDSRNPYLIPREGLSFEPKPPSEDHIFGTAQGQYDIYYGCIWGTRTAFRVGFMVVGISLAIGLLIGTTSGYFGGIVDEALMRFTDVIYAFPGLILCMAFVIALPSNVPIDLTFWAFGLLGFFVFALLAFRISRISGLPTIFLALAGFCIFGALYVWVLGSPGYWKMAIYLPRLDKVLVSLVLVGWASYTRVIRGEILRVKQEDYIEAAKAVGCSDIRVMVKHILPNAIYPLMIMVSLNIGTVVLTAATLSFLGLGAPIGYADWGQMISFARDWISTGWKYWYTFTIPGIFIFTFVLGWNLLGDAFRDILDPTLRRK